MIVYYGTHNNKFCESPSPLSGCLFENLEIEQSYVKCPAFQDYIKNIFVIRANHDYELTWNKEEKVLKSDCYGQPYFNKNVHVRNLATGLFSYYEPRINLFAEKSVQLSLIPPTFHKTLKGHAVIPGIFDAGKHLRKLELSFQFLHSDTIVFKEGDPLYYVKFHTDEKIVFKRFFYTEKLIALQQYFFDKRDFTKRMIPLKWYYENNCQKLILKEIKNNLMD